MRTRAIRLREEGATISEIADALGIARATAGDLVVGIDPLPHAFVVAVPVDQDAERLARLKHHCSRCNESKSWAEFWAAARWPDGTMRRPQARCKECVKAIRRELRQQDPEAARARDRHNWRVLIADPDRAARRRETQRENSTAFRRRQAERAA